MKRIWKTRRNEEAVSPVIATILMVAITVVLAAVLYVMVIGFGGGGQQAPPGTFKPFDVTSNQNVTITFDTFSPAPKPMDIKVILTPSSATLTDIEYTFSTAPSASDTTMVATTGTAIYHDYSYAGNEVNAGDYIKVTGLTPNTSYTIKVFYHPSNSMCSLTGITTFSTPP